MKKTKKIIINKAKKLYVKCIIFDKKEDMRAYYKKYDVGNTDAKYHDRILGFYLAHEVYSFPKGTSKKVTMSTQPFEKGFKGKLSKHSGTILVCLDWMGASVVGHEFMHGVLFGLSHGEKGNINRRVIKNMEHEEVVLHDWSDAIHKFYDWYFKITKKGKFIK